MRNFALSLSVGSSTATLLPSDATDTGIPVGPEQNWLRYSFLFRPGVSGTVPLVIFNIPDGISTLDGGINIDAVAVTAVPEPPIWYLLIAGLGLASRWLGRRANGYEEELTAIHDCFVWRDNLGEKMRQSG